MRKILGLTFILCATPVCAEEYGCKDYPKDATSLVQVCFLKTHCKVVNVLRTCNTPDTIAEKLSDGVTLIRTNKDNKIYFISNDDPKGSFSKPSYKWSCFENVKDMCVAFDSDNVTNISTGE